MARPKRVFSEEDKQRIEEYALNNCHFETISMALEIPVNTLKRRFGRFIRQKRAEGRVRLRGYQVGLAENSPAMAIFLGKNELNQQDKQIIKTETVLAQLTDAEQATIKPLSREYKLMLARGKEDAKAGPRQA